MNACTLHVQNVRALDVCMLVRVLYCYGHTSTKCTICLFAGHTPIPLVWILKAHHLHTRQLCTLYLINTIEKNTEEAIMALSVKYMIEHCAVSGCVLNRFVSICCTIESRVCPKSLKIHTDKPMNSIKKTYSLLDTIIRLMRKISWGKSLGWSGRFGGLA